MKKLCKIVSNSTRREVSWPQYLTQASKTWSSQVKLRVREYVWPWTADSLLNGENSVKRRARQERMPSHNRCLTLSFPGLPPQRAANWVASNNRNCLTVPVARGLKSRCQQGHAFPEATGSLLPYLFLAPGNDCPYRVSLDYSYICLISASINTRLPPLRDLWLHMAFPSLFMDANHRSGLQEILKGLL